MSTGTFWKVRKWLTSTAMHLQRIVFQRFIICSVIFMAHLIIISGSSPDIPMKSLIYSFLLPSLLLTPKSYCLPIINSWSSFSFFPQASSSFFYQVFSALSSYSSFTAICTLHSYQAASSSACNKKEKEGEEKNCRKNKFLVLICKIPKLQQ